MPIEPVIENTEHHNAKNGDREQSGPSRHGVVDSRCNANTILRDRIHHSCGKRSHTYRHTKPENHDRREKICPVASTDVRKYKEHKAKRGDQWTNNERKFWSVLRNKPARPARKRRNN